MIDSEIYQAFNDNPVAWENFKTFPKLYQRVRIDSIQRDKKKDRAVFDICLEKLIEQSEAGKCLVIGTIMADRLIIKQQKLSAFSGQFNMVKQGSHTLRCTAAFSSASIIYS